MLDAEIGLVLFIIPFANGDDLQSQVLGALSLQWSLIPLSPPIPPPDEYGTWQVALHWLVQEPARKEWENEIVRLRQRSGFSEELVLFLHQEDRALDAARATRGVVDLLGWAPEQQGPLRELELFAPGAVPAGPQGWFEQTRPAA